MAEENLYGDDSASGGQVQTQNQADVEQDPKAEHNEEGDGKTAIVPKDLCPDMKVGDEMVVKIVAEHEGDWEVAYAPEKGGKDKGEEKEMPEKEPAEGSMASMY